MGKVLISLLSPSAFTFASDALANREGANYGVGWGDLTDGPFPLLGIMAMLLVDTSLYAALAWYLDKVRFLTHCILRGNR